MTSFYSWRQFLMTFHGRYRGLDHQHLEHADHGHAHDEPGGAMITVMISIMPPSWTRFMNPRW